MRTMALAMGLGLCLAAPAMAAEDAAARAERWADVKHAVFGDRAVTDGSGLIVLEAPARALDAATVPVSVTLQGEDGPGAKGPGAITTVWILVDDNPSPLVGTFHFGPAADPHSLRTRVRVDQYTLIHAVAETQDGRLLATEAYVKAAGGCSAPSSKDPAVAVARLGQMRLRYDADAPPVEGATATAHLLISHPNNNGMQVDQLTHNFIPPRYIQDIDVTYGGERVLDVEADISLSEDPEITFGLRPHNAGPMRVEVRDSTRAVFTQEFPHPGPS